ncbi:MAG: glycosyltransferase family 2 protein [Reichenbachiella sp.]|uniref:glycosyltransferase family 2 protein n=1 Tax=Reichenbachiella sp. TaxID=2184521 RepID=UPI0032978EF1
MRHSNPLVSVIMPAYQAAPYITQAINSILNQTHENIEVLIADDGSKDQTLKIIDSFKDKRIKTFHNSINLGYLRTCNRLFDQCTGDYITFQDSDDWSELTRIEKQLDAFQKDPDLGLCGTIVSVVDTRGRFIRKNRKTELHEDIVSKIEINNQFGGATMMYTKEILNDIGGYHVFFDRIASEDYDLAYRIIEKYKGYNIQESLYYYRQVENSITKTADVNKILSAKAVHYFAEIRKKGLTYDLNDDSPYDIKDKFLKWKKPYMDDPSKVFHEYASLSNYNQLYSNSIKISWTAIKAHPENWGNYKLLLYCIKLFLTKKILRLK